MTLAQSLAAEFAITITNGEVWLSIGLALLLGGGCWVFGTWVARTVGLLRSDAPAGETLGVGLACGLMVLAAWWAAMWSGGRSSFTPVAVGFAIAIGLTLARRARRPAAAEALGSKAADGDRTIAPRSTHRRSLILTALAGAGFVVAVALLYGSTMVPSPRDGVQPVEFVDVAFYAILARDLATTGTETNLLASGFSQLPGLPAQTWYHWSAVWLASAVIAIFGTEPLAARYFIVLPVALLAAAALMGTLVRRMARTNSRPAYLLGFLACLFLAPVSLIPGPFFSSWAAGLIFGINLYGLGAVAVLLALYSMAVLGGQKARWGLAAFVGSAVAFILPAHIAIAVLAVVGVGGVWAIRIVQSVVTTRRLPIVSPIWGRTLIATGIALVGTMAWGMLTGHSLGGGGASPAVSPFNATWRDSVALTALGAGVFLAIPVAWFLTRKKAPVRADMYLATMGLLVAGAIGWGARLGDFTMFYLFFAGIAVFATPVAAVAVRDLWDRLRATHHRRLAAGLFVLCVSQLDLGVVAGIQRLQQFGSNGYVPISISLLDAIRQLPADAKLAYACDPFEESAFTTPRLLSIDAHTGRRVVPMCFEAEFLSHLIGAQPSEQVENLGFRWAPQREIYPNAAATPSSETVAAFLKDHGIHYIYADARHPNVLVDYAVPIATSEEARVLRVP